MKHIANFVVVYDISSNPERNRVERTLRGFGFRVQKSVFECRLTRKGRSDLIEKLESLNIATGFVKIYRLDYSSRQTIVGREPDNKTDNGSAYVI
jgi:CRISPR-associated protein Cas2